jgi:hypothetical protein
MKTIKIIAMCLLVVSAIFSTYAQTTIKTTESGGKKPAKIAKTKVPSVVTETYYNEYPLGATAYENWYGYPEFDYENDWYGYNPYLYEYENPEYYVVEFTKDKVPHKIIYSKKGKKIAAYKNITAELPKAVSSAISKSEYSTWKIAKEKEEIFRDTDVDKMKVYKVEVEKGKEKHHLFISSEGVLLKDKTMKP